MTDSLNVMRDQTTAGSDAPGSSSTTPFTRVVNDNRRMGRSGPVGNQSRRHRYDRVEGLATATLNFESDKADRARIPDAVKQMDRIHQIYGVDKLMEGNLYDVDHAMFICYALNGGSQISPHDRVSFSVMRPGMPPDVFEFKHVIEVLGVGMRRFFRTYADDVVEACKMLYYECDVNNPIQVEMRELMIQLADFRGLSRYPYLIADCADAALSINALERASIQNSKKLVIGATPNSVDKRNLAVPIRSSDNYDSSVGSHISAQSDIHSAMANMY